eukprot:TRINITY_DN13861_c0_g1_i1.p1 TRINITY_DN13861_c0_g1~~TRINITY_DN13861_c0_g1_i1.p1  ORF type:complete len:1141 (-),score=252.13 TRINITY_DN13861_c0_g1_i1:7-3429(-)
MKLKEIARNAIVAWSPSAQHPDLIATGAVSGSLDATFSSTAELEIFSLQLAQDTPTLARLGSATSPCRFNRLAWGTKGDEYGLLAGGLENGYINIWNPRDIVEGRGAKSFLVTMDKHQGAVRGLEFNSFMPNLLASGAADGEIYIWDLTDTKHPSVYSPAKNEGAELSFVTWNRKVQHILATTSHNGNSVVWDLKAKRSVVTFTNPTKKVRCSCLAWSTDVATQIIAASDDDRASALQLWDLRKAVSPVLSLTGHNKGVLSVSWCPHDPSLLLTCGKDNRTLCWDPSVGELLCELPASTNWNFDVQWSPRIPAVLSTASFDGKVSVHSLLDVGGSTPSAVRAPKWLKRPAGVCFGFGGKIASFNASKGPKRSQVLIHNVVTESQIAERAQALNAAQESVEAAVQFCENKAALATSEEDREVWDVMSMLLEASPRQSMLKYLGYDPASLPDEIEDLLSRRPEDKESESAISEASADSIPPASAIPSHVQSRMKPDSAHLDDAAAFVETPTTASEPLAGADDVPADDQPAADPFAAVDEPAAQTNQDTGALFGDSGADEEDLFASAPPLPEEQPLTLNASSAVREKRTSLDMSFPSPEQYPGAEQAIQRALLVANFSTVVDICLRCGRYADALMFAITGGPALIAKAQQAYLQRYSTPYLRLLSAITDQKLGQLVANASPIEWKDTLVLICSYAGEKDFVELCNMLGQRVESVLGDTRAALLCFMCAGNMDKVVLEFIRREASHEGDSLDALCTVVELVSIFRKATEETVVHDLMTERYALYARALASQGMLEQARQLLDSAFNVRQSEEVPQFVRELYDRVYRAQNLPEPDAISNPFGITESIGKAPTVPQKSQESLAQEQVYKSFEISPASEPSYPVQQQQQPAVVAPVAQPAYQPYGYTAPKVSVPATKFVAPVTAPAAVYQPQQTVQQPVQQPVQQYTQPVQSAYPTPAFVAPVTYQQAHSTFVAPIVQPAAYHSPVVQPQPQSMVNLHQHPPPGGHGPIKTNAQAEAVAPPVEQDALQVDVSGVAPELRIVPQTLTALIEVVKKAKSDATHNRMVHDICMKLGGLYVALRDHNVPPVASKQLLEFCELLRAHQLEDAKQKQGAMAMEFWQGHNAPWMNTVVVGLRTLVMAALKLGIQ